MSKFCTKCGRPLQEGEVCSCQLAKGNSAVGGQVPPNQQFAGEQVPPNQQFAGGQVPPNQQFAGEQVPPNQQFAGGQVPPNQQFAGEQVPPNQQFAGGQVPPNQQFAGGQVPPNQQFAGGQVPPNQQFAGGQVPPNQQFATQASAFAQNFFARVLNLIKRPVTAGKELIVEADVKVALLLIVFQGIFSALFAFAVAARCSQYIKAASGLADGISSGLGSTVAGALSMPYVRILLVTVLFSLALACVLALLLWLGHMIMKIPASFQQMLSATAIRSAVLVPAILLSIVVFELSTGVGIALFVLINIWGFAAMIVAMSSFIQQEKLNIFVLMVSIVILLFVVITVFTMSKIWTLYLPDLVRTGLNQLGKLSGGELLEEILGNFY